MTTPFRSEVLMVTKISIVAVPVDDIDEALRFFCDVLGMEKRKDLVGEDRYAGDRYVEVAPAGSQVALSPYTYYDREPSKATIGEYSRVVLQVEDVRDAHRELTAQGVQFESEPFDLHGGTFAAIRDPWNNLFVLSDRSTF
jgi:lactoylglutathione lyase